MKHKDVARRVFILIMSTISLLLQAGFFGFVWFKYYKPMVNGIFWIKGDILIIAIYFVLLFFFSRMYGGMRIGYLKAWEVFFSQTISTLGGNLLIYAVISLMSAKLVPAPYILLMSVADLAWIALWVVIANGLYAKFFSARKLLLVTGKRSPEDILGKFASRPDKYNIQKTMRMEEGYDVICQEILQAYDGVILWDISAKDRNKLLKFCYGQSIRVYLMPKIHDVLTKGAEEMHIFDTPMYLVRETALTFEERMIKRCIDIICSILLLVIASPFMLITALLIKLYDKGPVLYKQVRVTRGNKEFKIMKFRSMRVDAEKDGKARLASKNDSRITPIGKFIRACRIDELPQLLNILKGEMSFVGPRPERPEIIKQYEENMPEFAFRTKVKAGLCGYAQVYGKYNTTPYDKLKLDLTYIENYSVWLDLKLMLLTFKTVLTPESTEGVSENQTTALVEEAEEKEQG
ncbi:MAG: sugar transferase [Lachnospiraceae bacterium]|nr:sugar transferase [Lachnospiraceae bacterium]